MNITTETLRHRVLCVLAFLAIFYSIRATAADSLEFGRFGTVALYQTTPHPSRVVLFISGDGGWKSGVIGMARELATQDALVVGINIHNYMRSMRNSNEKCAYAAADFEALSKFVQKSLEFPAYIRPLLLGYSSGATLVYAILAEAPPNTFAGAISMGFCPDLPLKKPLCKGYGLEWEPGPKGIGYSFLPAKNIQAPWYVVQGTIDQVCDPDLADKYVKEVSGGAKLVLLPAVGHGFSVTGRWLPQLKQAMNEILERKAETAAPAFQSAQKDIPIVEVPARKAGPDFFAVIVSGDGGWASMDRDIANQLAAEGVPVVGFDSLQYFWTRRTPEEASLALQNTIERYRLLWKKDHVIVAGYSLGADVLPFMVQRLPSYLQKKIKLVALLGPDRTADFEFHVTDWLGNFSHPSDHPVLPEMLKMKGMKILCVYGDDDKECVCRDLTALQATLFPLSGGHHFGGNYAAITQKILAEAN